MEDRSRRAPSELRTLSSIVRCRGGRGGRSSTGCHVAFPSISSPVCRSTSARKATDSAAPDGCRRPPPNAPVCSINEGAVPSVALESSAAASSMVSSGRSDRHGSCQRSRDPAGARRRSTMSRRPRGVRMTTSMDGAERRDLERVAGARAGMIGISRVPRLCQGPGIVIGSIPVIGVSPTTACAAAACDTGNPPHATTYADTSGICCRK